MRPRPDATAEAPFKPPWAPVDSEGRVEIEAEKLMQDVVHLLEPEMLQQLKPLWERIELQQKSGEIPSVPDALMEMRRAVTGRDVWVRALANQVPAEEAEKAFDQLFRPTLDAAAAPAPETFDDILPEEPAPAPVSVVTAPAKRAAPAAARVQSPRRRVSRDVGLRSVEILPRNHT